MNQLIETIKSKHIEVEKILFQGGLTTEAALYIDAVNKLILAAHQTSLTDSESDHQEWENNSCLGFAVMAAVRIGLDEDETQKLIADMRHSFDFVSPGLAATVYTQSKYRM